MEVLLRAGMKFKTSQCLKRDSTTKFLLISQMLVRIGCLTLNLNEEMVVIHQVTKLQVPHVARSMVVNV